LDQTTILTGIEHLATAVELYPYSPTIPEYGGKLKTIFSSAVIMTERKALAWSPSGRDRAPKSMVKLLASVLF